MNDFMIIMLIMGLGYLLGRITVKGLSLGTSGILLVALVFGHFNLSVPEIIKNLGLICFVTSVGLMAGPMFFENFKKGALQYVLLGIITIALGAAVCFFIVKLTGISVPLALGLLNGALTSTPGLAAALEVTGNSLASVGYGIAYPFGVLGIVLFVQILPRVMGTNVKEEMQAIENISSGVSLGRDQGWIIEDLGLFVFALTVVLGLAIGKIVIPLGNSGQFSLGTSGGPLISGLLVGHLGHIGPLSLKINKSTLQTLRELGLSWFLLGAGTEAGKGFLAVLKEQGIILFVYGALMTILPMILTFFIARIFMKLSTMNALGSLCGGMTSTPALGTLIRVAGSDSVAVAYAATYPVALVMVVLLTQALAMLC